MLWMMTMAVMATMAAATPDGCAEVMDHTAGCGAPDRQGSDPKNVIVSDIKTTTPALSPEPALIAGILAGTAVATGLGGGGLLAAGLLTPATSVRDFTPVGLLAGGIAGLGLTTALLSSSVALLVFDPRTGSLTFNPFKPEEL
jgi:hypothetical protein